MNMKMLEAIGGVNDSFITALMEEEPRRRRKSAGRRLYWAAAAACLCLIIGTVIYLHSEGNQITLPFAITVYAQDQEGNVMNELLNKSRIPISVFYSDEGQPVFVFSHPSENRDEIHEISASKRYAIKGSQSKYNITGIVESPGNVYYYFFPNFTEEAPYSFTFPMETAKGFSDYDATFIITQANNQFFIELEKIEKVERKIISFETSANEEARDIPNWLREWIAPYQAIIDSLNEELSSTSLLLPEDSIWSFYESYKDKTPEQFEEDIRNELNEIEDIKVR